MSKRCILTINLFFVVYVVCNCAQLKIDTIRIDAFYCSPSSGRNIITGFNTRGEVMTLEGIYIPNVRLFPECIDNIEIGRKYEFLIDSVPRVYSIISHPYINHPLYSRGRDVYKVYNIIGENVYSVHDKLITTALYSFWNEFLSYSHSNENSKHTNRQSFFVTWFTKLPKVDNFSGKIYPDELPIPPHQQLKACKIRCAKCVGVLRQKELSSDDVLLCKNIRKEQSILDTLSFSSINFIRNYKKVILCESYIEEDSCFLVFDNDSLIDFQDFLSPLNIKNNEQKEVCVNYVQVTAYDSIENYTYGELVNQCLFQTKEKRSNNTQKYNIYLVKHVELKCYDPLPLMFANSTIENNKSDVFFSESYNHSVKTVVSTEKPHLSVEFHNNMIKNRDALPKIVILKP